MAGATSVTLAGSDDDSGVDVHRAASCTAHLPVAVWCAFWVRLTDAQAVAQRPILRRERLAVAIPAERVCQGTRRRTSSAQKELDETLKRGKKSNTHDSNGVELKHRRAALRAPPPRCCDASLCTSAMRASAAFRYEGSFISQASVT